MTRGSVLFWVTLAVVGCGQSPPAALRRPNILLVYTDDQRFDSLSFAGNPIIETPNLDRIARQGMWFARAYVVSSRCCPGRASMLTGKYPHVTGVWSNHPEHDLLERHRSIADELDDAGYDTAWIGKWHLPNPGAAPVRGFDHWVSYEGPGGHFDQTFNVDGESVASTGFQADRLTDYALEFLERERAAEAPFFLVLAFKNPHVPMTPAPRHAGVLGEVPIPLPPSAGDPPASLPAVYRRMRAESRHSIEDPGTFERDARAYWELVLSIDDNVGRVLDALEAQGVLDETIVVLTTDNGQLLGEHGLQQKGLSYEPSIRVPLTVRYPPAIRAGSRSEALVLNVDLFPTLLELAGLAVSGDVQGRSLAPLFADPADAAAPAAPWRERFLYLAPGIGQGAVVERCLVEARWKYVLIRAEGLAEEFLFDLENDPDERRNAAADPANRGVLERLRAELQAEQARLGVAD